MRTKNAIINSTSGAVSYLVLMVSNFVTRAFFAKELGADVLGVNALFTNIISMLALAELGLGTGLIYKLYKPVAEHDVPRIKSLLLFYKRAYIIIGSVIAASGFALSFFVYIFDKHKVFSPVYLGETFFLFVLDVVASYLFAHQKALITADQKNYIINTVHAGEQVVSCSLQIVVLVATRSFVLYILTSIVCRLGEGFVINRRYRRLYPHITMKDSTAIGKDERSDLFRNINAMLYHRIGSFSLSSTSNMIISYFVNFVTVGMYSNYTLITNTINNLIAQMFQGATASFGDLLNTEHVDKAYEKFNVMYFINFLLASFCSASLYVLLEPFISLWLGSGYVFNSRLTLILIIAYFYIYSMRRVIFMARDSAGLYRPDRYAPLVETVLNIGLSFALVKPLGVNGVLMANLFSMMVIPFWIQPFIVYKHIFRRSVVGYFWRYLRYLASALLGIAATAAICSRLSFGSGMVQILMSLLAKGVVCVIVPNAINALLFCRCPEFRYAWGLIVSYAGSLLRKKDHTRPE